MKRAPNDPDAVEPARAPKKPVLEEVTVRFIAPSPPYMPGSRLTLPPATAERLIRAGLAEREDA